MHCHCGINNREPRWTFTDPCKPDMGPGARFNNLKSLKINKQYYHFILAMKTFKELLFHHGEHDAFLQTTARNNTQLATPVPIPIGTCM